MVFLERSIVGTINFVIILFFGYLISTNFIIDTTSPGFHSFINIVFNIKVSDTTIWLKSFNKFLIKVKKSIKY